MEFDDLPLFMQNELKKRTVEDQKAFFSVIDKEFVDCTTIQHESMISGIKKSLDNRIKSL
jgi:hypothetical protein